MAGSRLLARVSDPFVRSAALHVEERREAKRTIQQQPRAAAGREHVGSSVSLVYLSCRIRAWGHHLEGTVFTSTLQYGQGCEGEADLDLNVHFMAAPVLVSPSILRQRQPRTAYHGHPSAYLGHNGDIESHNLTSGVVKMMTDALGASLGLSRSLFTSSQCRSAGDKSNISPVPKEATRSCKCSPTIATLTAPPSLSTLLVGSTIHHSPPPADTRTGSVKREIFGRPASQQLNKRLVREIHAVALTVSDCRVAAPEWSRQ
ncbi:hypothetical protein B0T18DRAFT_393627 [Schizothecium vesticola]|uniref:Uncharacterized protein n=1 Tax=Schizothecium vesticola TaxID=314040 RepID=A0AA40EKE4_9PEZI|nr:hypothetical protein B0T18DRAFT_393627 [Schizothecium vesticola]